MCKTNNFARAIVLFIALAFFLPACRNKQTKKVNMTISEFKKLATASVFEPLTIDQIRLPEYSVSQKKKLTVDTKASAGKYCSNFVSTAQAKLSDVAMPFDAEVIYECCSDRKETFEFHCSSKRSPEELITFYVIAMEHDGWSVLSEVAGCEYLMVFDKPDRVCVLSIRDQQKVKKTAHQRVKFVLTVSPKIMNEI